MTSERIIIRHTSGSRANQTDEFPSTETRSLTIGREVTSHIKFDPDKDDLVSRHHATISRDPKDDNRFVIADQGSRNGTFVNRQRVSSPVSLMPGDTVQLGAGGPTFLFDLDPRPAWAIKVTKIAEYQPPATKVSSEGVGRGAPPVAPSAPPSPPGILSQPSGSAPAEKQSLGKATVERMISGIQSVSRRQMINVAAVSVGLILLVVGALSFVGWDRFTSAVRGIVPPEEGETRRAGNITPMTPSQIADRYNDSTVYIETSWKLIHIPTGKQIFQRKVDGKLGFVQFPDGQIEPWLTLDDKSHGKSNRSIGGSHEGSGFVVTESGFILTSRFIVAPWHTRQGEGEAGVVYKVDEKGRFVVNDLGERIVSKLERFGGWLPTRSRQLQNASEGRLDVHNVTFARNKLRIPAKPARISDEHDVALIKIDTPQSVAKVELFDSYDKARSGDAITVIGYPDISPHVVVTIESKDAFRSGSHTATIPEPSVTPANISKVIRGAGRPVEGDRHSYYSQSDSYQLTANATGAGNSGGPMFDDHGRVIGIFYAGGRADKGLKQNDPMADDARVTFAVPIKYGMRLMRIESDVGEVGRPSSMQREKGQQSQ